MDDEVLRILMTYLHRPAYGLLSKQDLLKRSYEDWTCGELIYRITDHPFDDPINIVEAFAYEMLSYSIVVRDVAYDLAKNVHVIRIFTIFNKGSKVIAKDPAEIFMSCVGSEASGICKHSYKS